MSTNKETLAPSSREEEAQHAQRAVEDITGEPGIRSRLFGSKTTGESMFTSSCTRGERASLASASFPCASPVGKGTSEAIADALSLSLASIAAESGRGSRGRSHLRRTAEDVSNCSESSSGSGLRAEGDHVGAAVVTGTTATTSSGGDDRDSLAVRHHAGGLPSNKSSSDSNRERQIQSKASHHQHPHRRRHHHHHHLHHQRRKEERVTRGNSLSDGYGLPVPSEDRLHTTVVAHLPPPSTDTMNSSDSGGESENIGGERAQRDTVSLLEPRREPGFHTIRRTFNRVIHRHKAKRSQKSPETDSSEYRPASHRHKIGRKRPKGTSIEIKELKSKKRKHPESSDRGSDSDDVGGNGSSSGSGTEGGYAASASSNAEGEAAGSCSSQSLSSSEESVSKVKRVKGRTASTSDPNRPMLKKKHDSSLYMSSEIADFGSSASSSEAGAAQPFAAAFRPASSSSPSITSSSDEQDDSYHGKELAHKVQKTSEAGNLRWPPLQHKLSTSAIVPARRTRANNDSKPPARLKSDGSLPGPLLKGKPPIMAVGCDVMAHILTFLEPPDILDVLTMPLSKDWLKTFTRQPELWRVLCLLEPFKAQVENEGEESDSSFDSYSIVESELRQTFGKFRLLYTNFVRCMRYLSRIKDDALHGRPPSVIDYAPSEVTGHNIGANRSLHQFLARARGVVVRSRNHSAENSDISDDNNGALIAAAGSSGACPIKRKGSKEKDFQDQKKKNKRVKYAQSALTQRLLGPASDGAPGNVELPWSCAIYSIVNWMVAFSEVEGIQTMCLKVLPFLLEDEQQRTTAQRTGLTDIVLRGMVVFPDSAALHTAAFHTIVLLARPLGGSEGMLFHTSMVNSSGIFCREGGTENGRNGIAVMLDSMRRFRSDEVLQAMSCWSLVNIALAPAQKEMLVKLGAIEATASAMMEHPYNAEVQFRALFALINLVIPSVSVSDNPDQQEGEEVAAAVVAPLEDSVSSEKEMLDEMVDEIAHLVVLSMKHFCASEAILNRACLVLHNLSLTQEYHSALLWTPNCYQMLEWCLANYPTDQVLQQSAAGTLHRLQLTLSNDETLRARFAASLQSQQQMSLEQAHQEAVILHEQHLQQEQVHEPQENA